MNHKDGCSCSYCSAKKQYMEALQKDVESVVAKYIQDHQELPSPESIAAFLDDEVKACSISVFINLTKKLVDLGYLPCEILNRLQQHQAQQTQQSQAVPVTPYTSTPVEKKDN